jgi:HEAT repeats
MAETEWAREVVQRALPGHMEMVNARFVRICSAAFLLLLIGVAIVVTSTCEPPEPVWNGKALSAWIDDLVMGSSKEIREPAEEAIRRTASQAIPVLLRMLRSRDTVSERVLVQLNRKQHLLHFPVTPAQMKRQRASLALQALGPLAKPAFPELKRMLTGDPEPEFVADALAAIGAESVSALLEAIPKVKGEKRCALYAAAAKWPSQQNATIPALLQSLQSKSAGERRCAAQLLGRLRGNPAETIPALTSILVDPDFAVRNEALSSLAEFGTNAGPALEPLRKLLRNPGWFDAEIGSNAVYRFSRHGDARDEH